MQKCPQQQVSERREKDIITWKTSQAFVAIIGAWTHYL